MRPDASKMTRALPADHSGNEKAGISAETGQPSVLLLSTAMRVGGAERVVLDLAHAFMDLGVPTKVMGLSNERQMLDKVDMRDIDIRFLGMRKTPAGLLSASRTLARLVRDEGIDIVHAHMPHAVLVASAARLLHGLSVPIVHTSHNSQFNASLAVPLWLTRRLRDVDVLLAPGQHESLNAARTAVIPNGTRFVPSTNSRRTDRTGPVLIFVGRLTDQKNPAALIDAFATLHRSGAAPGVTLKIAGDGPLGPDIARQVARLGLTESVHLLGVRSDIADLLSDADLFVMSSRFEGLPVAVLEAGAAGVPVVVPPVGALPWLLADDCGFLAQPEQLASTLAEVLADRAEANRRAANFKAKVLERFSLDRAVTDHLALYRQLLAESGKRGASACKAREQSSATRGTGSK